MTSFNERWILLAVFAGSDIRAFELEKLDSDEDDTARVGNSGCNAPAFTPSLGMLLAPLLLTRKRR